MLSWTYTDELLDAIEELDSATDDVLDTPQDDEDTGTEDNDGAALLIELTFDDEDGAAALLDEL